MSLARRGADLEELFILEIKEIAVAWLVLDSSVL